MSHVLAGYSPRDMIISRGARHIWISEEAVQRLDHYASTDPTNPALNGAGRIWRDGFHRICWVENDASEVGQFLVQKWPYTVVRDRHIISAMRRAHGVGSQSVFVNQTIGDGMPQPDEDVGEKLAESNSISPDAKTILCTVTWEMSAEEGSLTLEAVNEVMTLIRYKYDPRYLSASFSVQPPGGEEE